MLLSETGMAQFLRKFRLKVNPWQKSFAAAFVSDAFQDDPNSFLVRPSHFKPKLCEKKFAEKKVFLSFLLLSPLQQKCLTDF